MGTIEATPAKSDLELGVKTLAGTMAREESPFPDASCSALSLRRLVSLGILVELEPGLFAPPRP